MWLDEIPLEVKCLNNFEMLLIKQATTFQTITKLKPLCNKTDINNLQAVKGMSVHLPLPLRESHHYVQSKLPSFENLKIIVDTIPTKHNLAYRSVVNLDKVYNALRVLRTINPLYKADYLDFIPKEE